jgi:hypothetical protein
MNTDSFKIQMDRLAETYGANYYRSERLKIIWREINSFSDLWLERVVDHFIGSLRIPPLLPEFRIEISKERERLQSQEKKERRSESKESQCSRYSTEEIQTISRLIINRINGLVQDREFEDFTSRFREPPKL